MTNGPSAGKEIFFESSATVGRVESNDLVLVEPGVSRHHARIYSEQGIHILEDLKSINGTLLNGEKLTEEEVLRDGDYITLGPTTIQFSMLDMARGDPTAPSVLRGNEGRTLSVDLRTRTTPSPLAGFKGFAATRRGRLLIALSLLGMAGAASYLALRHSSSVVIFDRSDEILDYSEEDTFFNAVFGFGKYDEAHLSSVNIRFDYLGGRATLQYGAWGVDKADEVTILLNDEKVGQVPLTMMRWVYGQKMVLPREKLKKGKPNVITFRNVLNPAAREQWEICYLQILQEAIPPPDPQEARSQFDLAKKAWEDREIEPSNMYSALVGFKRARDLLENLPEKPELYQEALYNIERVDKALTRRFSDGLFSARRAEKVEGNLQKAMEILSRALRYFQKDDFRHREISRYLQALAEQTTEE